MPSLDEGGPVVLERNTLKVVKVFSLFAIITLPFEFPSPKNVSCQIWLKLAQCF